MMKKIFIAHIFLFIFLFPALAQTQADEQLFQEAKILIFDKKWAEAQKKLEELLDRFPSSLLFSQALFYRGKCLFELPGRQKEAIEVFRTYLQFKERNKSFAEEAEVSIIDLAFELYESGEKSFLEEIEKKLGSKDKSVRYYAAFKLSYAKDKDVAKLGIPVLQEIVRKEKDIELRDRAKIALLRISPEALKEVGESGEEGEALVLKIRVWKKGKKEAEVSINIPWALADLALQAIPDKDKLTIRKKGYDLDKIISELKKTKNIVEIQDEQTIIKIWIDKTKGGK